MIGAAAAATRLAVTGRGAAKGPKPAWLKRAVDFTVTGLAPGSTTIGLEARALGGVSEGFLAQRQLWEAQPDPGHTALDLVAIATTEAANPEATGEHFDRDVLRRLLALEQAAGFPGVSYELLPRDSSRHGVTFDASVWEHARMHQRSAPAPRAFIVTGQLDEIGHGKRWFRFRLEDGSSIPGRLHDGLGVETLRSLWGKPATVHAMVHFRRDGRAKVMEARRIGPRGERDGIFEKAPEPCLLRELPALPGSMGRQGRLPDTVLEKARRFDLKKLWGTWPGDEAVEELLAMLD